MTDQCKGCFFKGDINLCRQATCHKHESWYAKEQQSIIDELLAQNERLRKALRNATKHDWLNPDHINFTDGADEEMEAIESVAREIPAQSLEALKAQWLKGNTMNFGEQLDSDDKGSIIGLDTGRLVATFSHVSEGESFVECYNNLAGR